MQLDLFEVLLGDCQRRLELGSTWAALCMHTCGTHNHLAHFNTASRRSLSTDSAPDWLQAEMPHIGHNC